MYFLLKPNTHIFAAVKITFCPEALFGCFGIFPKSFLRLLLDFAWLLMCVIVCFVRSSGVRSLLLRILRVQRSSARQVHTLIILFYTQFLLCISFTFKDLHEEDWELWHCYVVHEVGTYDLSSPREYSLCHILLSHACRRGLVCVIHASCERINNLGKT